MDLNRHYQSYRESLRKDMLEDTEAYAKATPTSDKTHYNTIYEYMTDHVRMILAAIEQEQELKYRSLLAKHQLAMGMIFSKMVDEIMEDLELNDTNYFYLIRDMGWHWFKFSRAMKLSGEYFGLPGVTIIPRYSEDRQKLCIPATNYIDADEAKMLLGISEEGREKFFDIKRSIMDTTKFISMYADTPIFATIDKVNSKERTIYDWSLPLEKSYE